VLLLGCTHCRVVAIAGSLPAPHLAVSMFPHQCPRICLRHPHPQVPPPDEVTEGGSTPAERAAAFLEAALALGSEGPLDDGAITALVAAAKPLVLGDSDTLLQKKGYKVLASLAERRPAWAERHLGPLLELALRASPASVSSAKRYRLRLLRPLIMLLIEPAGTQSAPSPLPELDTLAVAPGVPGAAAIAAAAGDPAARREAVGRALVGELVLATKEANTKTREAAYTLLVELAHELDEARPLELMGGGGSGSSSGMGSDNEEGGGSGGRLSGGLIDFFNAVLAGMAGGTPHMVSATVMAAARLLFEFSGELSSLAPQLLATVLLLLRSPSREVVKSVLGFVKVSAMRLPADTLTAQLPVSALARGCRIEASNWLLCPAMGGVYIRSLTQLSLQPFAMQPGLSLPSYLYPHPPPAPAPPLTRPPNHQAILEGLLLWSEDSKNRFRLKTRAVVERLVRRCGLDAVQAACPEGEGRLIAHIRKQNNRKERRRTGGSEAGSEVGGRALAGGGLGGQSLDLGINARGALIGLVRSGIVLSLQHRPQTAAGGSCPTTHHGTAFLCGAEAFRGQKVMH
jgi:hypothetical protein